MKPFLDPKTFRKVKFVYSKNAESQKILTELFEEDTIKSTFEDPNDYTHEDYAKLMEDDDLKSALYWKGAGETKPEDTEAQKEADDPSVDGLKIEDAPANGHTEAAEAPAVAAPTPAPVVAPVS